MAEKVKQNIRLWQINLLYNKSYDLFFKSLREKNYKDFKSELEARLEG